MGSRTIRPWCLLLLFLLPLQALALPVFARKYGVSCAACHEVWPKLNDNGQLFRDNGYRFNREKDNPVTQPGTFWPIAMRTSPGFQYNQNTAVQVDDGAGGTKYTNTQTGSFGFTGLDVLTGGALGEQYSWLLVYTPGLNSSTFRTGGNSGGDLESAWFGFHRIGGTPFLNVRIGKGAPDLPVDEHRTLTLSRGYVLYHFHPQGTAVSFEPGNNQAQLELSGHSELGRFRYSVSLLNENAATFSNNFLSTPALWGHVTYNQYLDSDILAAIKFGLFGAYGWHPTVFSTVGGTATTPGSPLDGTGSNLKPWDRIGAELHLTFLSTVNPLTLSGVVQYANEDQALVSNLRNAQWFAAFVEANYSPTINWSIIARYDMANTLVSGLDTTITPQNEGDFASITAAVRHTFELTSRTEAAAQIEFSQATTQNAAATTAGVGAPRGTSVLFVVDFAF